MPIYTLQPIYLFTLLQLAIIGTWKVDLENGIGLEFIRKLELFRNYTSLSNYQDKNQFKKFDLK